MSKKICQVPECDRKHKARGYCDLHEQRMRLTGKLTTTRRPNGTGGIKNGYIIVAGQYQHRTVMEQILGRALLPDENVHHKNGNRQDNNPDNLELWVTIQPAGQRAEDLLEYADEIIRRYRGHASS